MVEDNDFGELSKEEKIDLLERLSKQLGVEPGTFEDVGVTGELTVRVLDKGGEEKVNETKSFKC